MSKRGKLGVVLVALWTGAMAQAGIQVTATDKLADGAAYCPDISPDGKAIVFARTEGTAGNICLLDTEAGFATESGLVQVIHKAAMFPTFSPDGALICFATDRHIGVMKNDGSGVRILTTNHYSASPHWAPDGKTIYYIEIQNNKLGVFALDVDAGASRIVSQRNEMDAVPSPDGSHIAFVSAEPNGARALGVMGADGSNPRLLLRGNTSSGGYFATQWSPDGKWILMVYSLMQPADNIMALSIDGLQRVMLTSDNARNSTPVWSRDGKTILFTKLAQQGKKELQTLYRMEVAVDSAGIEDRLATLGTVYDPADKKPSELAIPPLVGPDLKVPLNVEPVPGSVESVCLNGQWEAIFGKGSNAPPETGWKPVGIPSWFTPWGSSTEPVWFRVRFVVPSEYRSFPYAELNISCVDVAGGAAAYYLNGVQVGQSPAKPSPDIPVRIRLDDRLRWGQTNELQVFLQASKWAYPPKGIRGDVYLKFYPALYVDNIIVRTSVRKQTIESRVYVRNLTKQAADVTVTGDIKEEDGRAALEFEAQRVTVPPGAMTEVLFAKAWTNAVLWGFGNYGTQHLYFAHHAVEQKGKPAGQAFARFGFREFWAQGIEFMFNGKPFFIKGDLCGLRDYYQNRGFVLRQFQFLREGNMNFIRHHPGLYTFAGHDVWYDVADEVGMLVEPQLYLNGSYGDTGVEMQWREFIWAHANHPSIVIYSADNECLSASLPMPAVYSRMNYRGQLLHALDPTRLVEWHGSPGLSVAAAMGLYDNMQVWNTHPYGTPLGDALKAHMQAFQYNGKVPIHVGEMVVSFGGGPFNWWTTPGEIVRSKPLQNAYALAGDKLAMDIRSLAEAGARGASLCSSEGSVQSGPDGEGGFSFGPWQEESMRVDRLMKDGKPIAPGAPPQGETRVNSPTVEIKWPSLSGRGMRPASMGAGGYVTGSSSRLINWFDPSRPAYTYNGAMLKVREAFRDVDGQEPGPLAALLKPEVVVMFAPGDTPAAGVFVNVLPQEGQPWEGFAVMTDTNGTAWFVLPAAGRYQASATWNGISYTNTFVATTSPMPPREKSGYDHVQFVDLAGKRAEKMRTEWLPLPAIVTVSNRMEIDYGTESDKPQPGKPRKPSRDYAGGPYRPDRNGFIRNWLVCGPFPNVFDPVKQAPSGLVTDYLKDSGGESGIIPAFAMRHKVMFPEGQSWKPGATEVFWDYLASSKSRVNLRVLTAPEMDITGPPSNVVGYAACYVEVEADTELQLALGFDDSGKVILNGETVGVFPEHGAAREDASIVPVRLKKGRNRLLLKVDQSTEYYGFFCRFLKDQKPFTEYRVWLKAAGYSDTHYVDKNNANPVPPYTNGWSSAATNIQDAVNQAATIDGAVILVARGVYYLSGPIQIDKAITLKASGVDPADTVIHGNYPFRTNRCIEIYHTGARVEGFTITEGKLHTARGGKALDGERGGGIIMFGGTLANCIVASNSVADLCQYGGGIHVAQGVNLITNCTIRNNTAQEMGGGVAVAKLAACTIANCLIAENSVNEAQSLRGGGGVYSDSTNCIVRDCVIRGNTALYEGGGFAGKGLVEHCTIISNFQRLGPGYAGGNRDGSGGSVRGMLRHCLIAGNSSGGNDGAIGLWAGSILENCTVVSNRNGGVLFLYGGAITNSTIHHNGAWDMKTNAGAFEYPAGKTK
ncbi:MAG: right-handed parallel beta-helix repeat-containing protein [Kiritimatiellae bacterium]|nr:right-handed parallel beta-helix repeat-containing protein [Kiritimatiellia bacterium]